jgi:hypothetical protein
MCKSPSQSIHRHSLTAAHPSKFSAFTFFFPSLSIHLLSAHYFFPSLSIHLLSAHYFSPVYPFNFSAIIIFSQPIHPISQLTIFSQSIHPNSQHLLFFSQSIHSPSQHSLFFPSLSIQRLSAHYFFPNLLTLFLGFVLALGAGVVSGPTAAFFALGAGDSFTVGDFLLFVSFAVGVFLVSVPFFTLADFLLGVLLSVFSAALLTTTG